MTALQSIIKEAKSLRSKYPKRFAKWTEYVAQASAIYASKHKGKSPIGKKKSKKIGALPIGFRGSIYDIGFKIVNQYDIYNDVSSIMEDTTNGNRIVTFDGKGSAKDKAEAIVSYISKNTNIQGGYRDDKQLYSRMLKFATNMQKEVKDFNSGKKKTIKKEPLKIPIPKNTIMPKKKKLTKKISKKVVRKKVANKKLTRIDYDKRYQAKKPGKRKSASGKTYYENRPNRSDKGKLLGIGQLTKIIGSVSGKYYIDYISDNGYKKMEFFNKFPKGYYKGMDRIIYVTRLTKNGTSLIPVKYSDNNKDVKK
jgi:hypothetical protein